MGKTRVHLLAKELGIETKDLIAQLDKLGMRGRKAQSAMEDDEVTRVRAALAAQEKPQVHVGEEKVIARVVKTEEEGQGSIEARETVVERRVRTNVIRRRTSRIEVAPVESGEQTPVAPAVAPQVAPEQRIAVEPAAAEEAQIGSLLGNEDGRQQREDHDGTAEPQPLGHRGKVGVQHERVAVGGRVRRGRPVGIPVGTCS